MLKIRLKIQSIIQNTKKIFLYSSNLSYYSFNKVIQIKKILIIFLSDFNNKDCFN